MVLASILVELAHHLFIGMTKAHVKVTFHVSWLILDLTGLKNDGNIEQINLSFSNERNGST